MMKKRINNILIIISIILAIYQFLNYGYSNIGDILCFIGLVPILCIPKIVRYITKIKINDSLEMIYIIFVMLAFLLGSIMKFYHQIFWFDSFTHFISGILTTMLAVLVMKLLNCYNKKKKLFNVIFMLAFTLMIAVFWEVIEFTIDNTLGLDTQKVLTTGVNDTMKDMICALFGAITFFILNQFKKINNFVEKL